MSSLGNAAPSPTQQGGEHHQSSPSLPPELLTEVLSRCDHETLVHCAVSSKLLCRRMRDDPAFLRRAGARGFAPSLFLGVFSGTHFVESRSPAVVPREPIRSFLSGNARFLGTFDDLLACGGGLVVLRRGVRNYTRVDLCVCDPTTGNFCLLPAPEVGGRAISILDGGEDDSSAAGGSRFRLLAARLVSESSSRRPELRSQLFSSLRSLAAVRPGGAWSPVRRHALPDHCRFMSHYISERRPVVIGRAAHWLLADDVVALHGDDGRAELITGPTRNITDSSTRTRILVSTADRRLSMVVADHGLISVLVLSEVSRNWEQHATVATEGILAPHRSVRLECFGQRSGTVVIRVEGMKGCFLLNLETMEVESLPDVNLSWTCHVYETDLPSIVATVLNSPSS